MSIQVIYMKSQGESERDLGNKTSSSGKVICVFLAEGCFEQNQNRPEPEIDSRDFNEKQGAKFITQ